MEQTAVTGRNETRVPIIASAALIALLVIGALATESTTTTVVTTVGPPNNARAVVVPTNDGVARTVVVPPCNTPVIQTLRNAAKRKATPNTVALVLSAGPSARAVIVPDCLKASGAVTATGGLPSAAFVLPVGVKGDGIPTLQLGARSQVIVPAGSPAKVLVVPPCTGRVGPKKPAPSSGASEGQDVVLSPRKGSDTVAAPAC